MFYRSSESVWGGAGGGENIQCRGVDWFGETGSPAEEVILTQRLKDEEELSRKRARWVL